MSDSSFVIGQRVGQKFKDSTIDQLNAILAKAGVNVASLGDGGASEYGSGGRYTGGGRSAGGRAGSRSIGGGHTYRAADKPYRGEPVLDETVPADSDAAKAIREGFKGAQDSEIRLQHGAGTPDQGTSDTARDPGAAKESDRSAATRDPNLAQASAGTTGKSLAATFTPDELAEANKVAKKLGVSVESIAGVARIESGAGMPANSHSPGSQYHGIFQMNQEEGYVPGSSRLQQIQAYGRMIDQKNYAGKLKAAGVDIASLPPSQQAAILQGFQFAPNATGWLKNFDQQSTSSKQSSELKGGTSVNAMSGVFEGLMGGTKPVDAAGGRQSNIGPGDTPSLRMAPDRTPEGPHMEASTLDPRLREIVGAAGAQFEKLHPGYKVEAFSGRRHGAGQGPHASEAGALDMQIRDPEGKVILSRGDDPTGFYHDLARISKGEMLQRHPDLARRFNWGGAFPTGTDGRGPPDLMHFDLSGVRGRWQQNRIDNMDPLPGLHYGPDERPAASGKPSMPLSDPQEGPAKPQSTADQLPFKVAGGELPPRVSKENAYAPGKMYESTAPIDPPTEMKGQDKGDFKTKDPKDYEPKNYWLPKMPTPQVRNEPKKEEPKEAPKESKKSDTKEG